MKKETGITLVSLVVTIIILIILAEISMNTLVGNNGIITKAQQAKENITLAQEEEAKQLNQLYSQLNSIGSGSTDTGDSEAIEKLLNFKKVIATAITNEGVATQETDAAEVMASHIGKILQERTKDATATAEDITEGKTAWANGQKLTGTGANLSQKLTIPVLYGSSVSDVNHHYAGGGGIQLQNVKQISIENLVISGESNWPTASYFRIEGKKGNTSTILDTIWGPVNRNNLQYEVSQYDTVYIYAYSYNGSTVKATNIVVEWKT